MISVFSISFETNEDFLDLRNKNKGKLSLHKNLKDSPNDQFLRIVCPGEERPSNPTLAFVRMTYSSFSFFFKLKRY